MINLKQALSTESSRILIDAVVDHIGYDQKIFDELYDLIFSENYPICMRSAWAAMHACRKNPPFFIPYTNDTEIKKGLSHPANGVKRCFLKILSEYANLKLLADCGLLFNLCFNIIENPTEAVANKAYAMEIVYKICKKEPDLANEVVILLRQLMEEEQLPGFRSKAKKIIKALSSNNTYYKFI